MPHGYRAVDVPKERQAQQMNVTEWGFAFAAPPSGAESFARIVPWDRARGVEIADASHGTEGELIAFHASHKAAMRVPGGTSVPTAGLAFVTVLPGHRRRGILRSMIAEHFERSLARGEIVSTLYASEARIYQNFGYGHAGFVARVNLGRGPGMRQIPGAAELPITLENANLATHAPILRAVQERTTRPGTFTQCDDAIIADCFMDMPEHRDGKERLRIAWVEDDQGPAAYAIFARKGKWELGIPNGEVEVHRYGAATPAAMQRLFSVVADLDLMSTCFVPLVPLDSPLFHMMEDSRSLGAGLQESIWVRVLDAPKALAARGYSTDIEITFSLTDAMVPSNAGTWRLVAAAGGSNAQVTSAEGQQADVTLDIQELSAAYLGGVSLLAAAGAGLVQEHREGAVAQLSLAFQASEQPVCNYAF